MDVLPSKAFLDLKKEKLFGEENGEFNRLAISKAWPLLCCSEAPPLGPAESAGIWEAATPPAHVAFISHHFARKHN